MRKFDFLCSTHKRKRPLRAFASPTQSRIVKVLVSFASPSTRQGFLPPASSSHSAENWNDINYKQIPCQSLPAILIGEDAWLQCPQSTLPQQIRTMPNSLLCCVVLSRGRDLAGDLQYERHIANTVANCHRCSAFGSAPKAVQRQPAGACGCVAPGRPWR